MKNLIFVLPALYLMLGLVYPAVVEGRSTSYPVAVDLAGFSISTTVESAVARDILAGTLEAGEELDCQGVPQMPRPERLRAVTRAYGADAATALLLRCLLAVPENARTQRRFLIELQHAGDGAPTLTPFLTAQRQRYTVLFVPGWDYVENAAVTGADLAEPRRVLDALGFETRFAPLPSTGSVEDSAEVLRTYLKPLLAEDKGVILASASSGGPVTALALSDPDIRAHPQLVGWLNICGVLRGTPLIDRFLTWPRSLLLRLAALWEGWDYDALLSLSRSRSGPRFKSFHPPQQLTIVNYIGIPFATEVSDIGRDFYEILAPLGPNDGLTPITDALAPGYTVLALGSDHFLMEDPDIADRSVALLTLLLKLIEERN